MCLYEERREYSADNHAKGIDIQKHESSQDVGKEANKPSLLEIIRGILTLAFLPLILLWRDLWYGPPLRCLSCGARTAFNCVVTKDGRRRCESCGHYWEDHRGHA